MNILHINNSIKGSAGASSQLSSDLVKAIATNTNARVTLRDLTAEPVPHLSLDTFEGFSLSQEQRSEEQQRMVALSDKLITELEEAELIVLALPMYNFGIPSHFKAWIDHIARAGVTFNYTASGPVGVMTGKQLVVVATRGGVYSQTPNDHQSPYIQQIFGFIGIDDIQFIYAEGLASPAHQAQALQNAAEQIKGVAEQLSAAPLAATI